jgi:bifunctional non-homologous end joining protein LigD
MNQSHMAQWSTRTARIRPCQPTLANRVPTGSEWIHELKYDGYRVVARRDGDIVRLWSRAGLNWAYDFPRIVEALRRLPIERIIIDGEAVCLRDDDTPDFRTLRSRRGCRDARLMAFDLLGLEGTSTMPWPRDSRAAARSHGRGGADRTH